MSIVRKSTIAACAFAAIVASSPARADDAVTAPALITFDEIDHVYASGDVSPPGAFDQSLRQIAHANAPSRKRSFLDGAMHGISVAGTQIGNVASIVGASGQLGQTLQIASGAAALAPVADAMGLAGSGRLDALVQTYVLPRVSPSGAQMLSGYLAAQKEIAARYSQAPGAVAAPAATPSAAPPQAQDSYARGMLRTYTIASTGRVRIDDPDQHVAIVFAPDIGKTYAIDDANRTVHVTAYDPALAQSVPPVVHAAAAQANPALQSRVEPLPATTLGQTPATGFHTHVVMHVRAGTGACTQATVTSDRIEYFAPIQIASTAANSSPFAPTDARDTCVPTGAVIATGATIPADRLLMYQANAVQRTTNAGSERYTLVIERGNLRTAASASAAPFEIPDGYRQI